jgi:hypothetical protein
VSSDVSGAATGEVSGGAEDRQAEADLHHGDASGVEAPSPGHVCHHDDVSRAGGSGEQDQHVTEAGPDESAALSEQSDSEDRDDARAIEGRREARAVNPLL